MAEHKGLNLTLKVWRQENRHTQGRFETYEVHNISTEASFLEMMDILNEQLINEGKQPVAFDHDCREGICGMCSLFINGRAHGPDDDITTCQLHMRKFHDGQTITIEPWRSGGFPIIRDLMVDRSAYDKIMQAGGFISVSTGGVPDANAIPIPKADADEAMDSLYWLWRMCRHLQERLGNALRIGKGFATRAPSARSRRGRKTRQGNGSQDGRTRLRQLHQHRCLRTRMSKERLHRPHRKAQQGVLEG